MSEKQQGTVNSMRERMLVRYGDGFHHKHNKNHIPFRQHCRSHPVKNLNNGQNNESEGSTGLIGIIKSRKIRKRLDNRRIH